MLELHSVDTFYGPSQVLDDVSLKVNQGEIVCLLGANAAGKTTTMKTIFGIVRPRSGTVMFEGQQISGTTTDSIIAKGLALVPEGRRVFPRLSVHDNLRLGGASQRDQSRRERVRGEMLELFPVLGQRLRQEAGTLSGGEQQMLAIGRALMSRPRLMCMDEPSMGLSPILVQTVFDTIREIRDQGVTIFVVEQNAYMALHVADRGYVLQTGKVVLSDTAPNLLNNDLVRRAYLGA